MAQADETYTVAVEADTAGLEREFEKVEKKAGELAASLTGAFRSAVTSGQSLSDTLRSLALDLAGLALDSALQPVEGLLKGAGMALFGNFSNAMPFAQGGVLHGGAVVGAPGYFRTGSRTGVLGEAGAEAIMPLSRGSDGRLGVAAAAGPPAAHVTVNISAADVASFRRSQAQIAGAIARAVAKGQRTN